MFFMITLKKIKITKNGIFFILKIFMRKQKTHILKEVFNINIKGSQKLSA